MKVLAGKSALVTGGSRGIGAAIVRRLANDGAAVALTYTASRDRAEAIASEIRAAGGDALAIKADSASVTDVQNAVAQTAERFGKIDILVNNAGILSLGPIDDFEIAEFDRTIAINVRAVFVAAQAVLPHMGAGGRIVTIGSITADHSHFPGGAVYSMSKGAVAALTRGLARDLGPRGITVNTVQPGPTETDMNADEDMRSMLRPLIPLGRLGKDTEIASLVGYLASPRVRFHNGCRAHGRWWPIGVTKSEDDRPGNCTQ